MYSIPNIIRIMFQLNKIVFILLKILHKTAQIQDVNIKKHLLIKIKFNYLSSYTNKCKLTETL